MRKPSVLSALLLLCPLFNFPFAPAKIKDLKVHIDLILHYLPRIISFGKQYF